MCVVVNGGLWLQLSVDSEKGLAHTGNTTMAPIEILGCWYNTCAPGLPIFLYREMEGRAFLTWAQHSTGETAFPGQIKASLCDDTE